MAVSMGEGPTGAKFMLVGEAWGMEEERARRPFVGPSGQLLNSLLHEAGIMRSDCYVTNVVNARPLNNDMGTWIAEKKKSITPAHVPFRDKHVLPIILEGFESLRKEIALVSPEVIIAFGNTPLWALTGAWGITKWRGSTLEFEGKTVVPVYHPAAILRQWDWKNIAVQDLRRAKRCLTDPPRKPNWNFILRPSFDKVVEVLQLLYQEADQSPSPVWIEVDLETRAGHIACCGLSWSLTEAISIPFMCVENKEGYWLAEQEAFIIYLLYRLLTHQNVAVRWQNGLYDAQYIYRHWHFIPRGVQDTMISQHTMWAGLKKALDFQASMYCNHYVYWKDDGKTWDKDVGEDQLWSYNCVDCVRTREVGEVEQSSIFRMGLQQVEDFQQALFYPVLQAMLRGVRVDVKARETLTMELQDEMSKRESLFYNVLGHQLNPRSPTQMKKLFYEDLQQPPIFTRAKKGKPGHITLDDKALETIASREPVLKPLVSAIQEYRSLGVFLSTFVLAPLDVDGRMRCSYNICGTETYRFSSRENAFGSGTNLQNLPKGDESGLFPNIRKLFIPDPGFTFFDMDLDRADLQVVVWEANDEMLKAALRLGVDMHLLNAYSLAQKEPPPLEELVESHPKYQDHRGPMKNQRQFAKAFIHGTNYGGGERTMAIAAGVTVHQAGRFQKLYFGKYPGIKRWHERTLKQLTTQRYVENKFGYRRYYFDRVEGLLPEALAWIPQSTVAIYINKIWKAFYDRIKDVQVLLQVHDSLAGQIPTHKKDWCVTRMKEESKIIVPYEDPLIIPVGIKLSDKSWGDCGNE